MYNIPKDTHSLVRSRGGGVNPDAKLGPRFLAKRTTLVTARNTKNFSADEIGRGKRVGSLLRDRHVCLPELVSDRRECVSKTTKVASVEAMFQPSPTANNFFNFFLEG